MPSSKYAVHDGTTEGRHHAEADEHDGRDQLGQRAEKRVGVTHSRYSPPDASCPSPTPPPRTHRRSHRPMTQPGPRAAFLLVLPRCGGRRAPGSSAHPLTNNRLSDHLQLFAITNSATTTLNRICVESGFLGGRLCGTDPSRSDRTRSGLRALWSEKRHLVHNEALPVFTPKA